MGDPPLPVKSPNRGVRGGIAPNMKSSLEKSGEVVISSASRTKSTENMADGRLCCLTLWLP